MSASEVENSPSRASTAWEEGERLAALERYAILDTPREQDFDDIVRLAADIFEAPIAVVNLIASSRQWFKAEVGIGADELPLDVSICAHAILQPGIFVVPDTTQDPRFECNPLVTGEPGLRFYAGALLETPEGLPLGTVCVLDTEPRPNGITDRQRLTLEVLARQAMTQLELRRAVTDRDQRAERLEQAIEGRLDANRVLRETDRRLNAVLDNTRMAVFLMDGRQHCVYANAAAEQLTGYAFEQMQGRPLHDVVHHKRPDGSHYPLDECPIDRAFPERAQMSGEELFVAPDGSFYPVAFTASPVLDDEGQPIGTVIEARNIAADKSARERLQQLAAVAQESRDFIGVADPSGRPVFVNEAGRAMMGLPSEEAACAVGLLDYFAPADREIIATEALPAAIDQGYWEGEVAFRRFDDSREFPVLYNIFPIRDAAGEVSHFATVTRDLTESKAADAERRAAEERLRALNADLERQVTARAMGRSRTWQLSTDLIGVLNKDGYFEQSNPAWQTVLGWSEEEIASTTFLDFIHPDDRPGTDGVWADVVEHGQATPYFENRYRTKDGRWRWLSWVTVPDGEKIYCSARDITAQKEQAEQLKVATAERDTLATLVSSTETLVQVLDVEFRFLAINRANADEYQRIYGFRPTVGDSLVDLLADRPDLLAEAQAVWRRALAGEAFTSEGEYGDPEIGRRIYDLKFDALRDDAGQVWAAYAFAYDVTEQRAAAAELERVQEALRQSQKMEAVGQLTGGIAHDFNNMLAVVIGSLDLLKRRVGMDDARTKRYVDAASEGARRAATLTQRLLAFSRQQPLKPEPVDANKLVAGMSDLLHHSLGGDILLESVLAAGLWRTHADPNQLENVILNLAINGRDAMEGGGRLTIETANCHLDDRYAAAHLGVPAGQYVMIAVTDTGSGMPAEVIAKAFDPFFTTKGVGKGTGLGLSQVYGFVKQSGGHVKIYSEPGEGTTIKVYLPRLSGAGAEIEQAAAEAALPLGDRQDVVLVVEDEPAVRQLSVDALTELGYRVLKADGADAALRLLDAHPEIALMFTDIVMPEVNGAKLAEEALRRRPDLKVLFTTGYTRNAVVHNGVVDPGVELIGKPFTIEELAAKVRAVLDATR